MPGKRETWTVWRIEKKMEITLPLEKMTVAEKLRVMESLWRDLTRDEQQLESPEWHGEVLPVMLICT
jgi:hypothetical protein